MSKTVTESKRIMRPAPLSECAERIRRDARQSADYYLKLGEERVAQMEGTRRAMMMLDASGFDLRVFEWSDCTSLDLPLGFFPNTKRGNADLADTVRRVRLALDCRLTQDHRDVSSDGKRVVFTLKPVDFPGVRVTFERNLPSGAKCKIVRRRSTYATLVCEVDSARKFEK